VLRSTEPLARMDRNPSPAPQGLVRAAAASTAMTAPEQNRLCPTCWVSQEHRSLVSNESRRAVTSNLAASEGRYPGAFPLAVIFARIRVHDVVRWHKALLESEALRREHGIVVRSVYRDSLYSNGFIIVLDAEDLERAKAFYALDQLRDRLAQSGVEWVSELWMGTEYTAQEAAEDREGLRLR
jgi:hypothetical protein